ncbi:flocculation protein FLO11-like [Ixodes scapularis]|uniref:flocculation protein FLO11-like n=1 Tax=Ixodes scapularis TaxID=6945 RepID=UPI001C38A6F4|nr:flocculation protein FLO11-like [Ixodes scapularis]
MRQKQDNLLVKKTQPCTLPIPQLVEPKPALAAPTADILRNPIQTELKETHQKGTITVALDELQVPAAVSVEAEQMSSPINTSSEVNSGQEVIVPPINKVIAPEVIPIEVVPVINKASEASFENSPAETPGISGVNTVISIPQNEVQPGSSKQTPGPLLNAAAGEPQNPNGQAGEKTPATISTVVVTKINFDGPHSTQDSEPIKTELKDDARPKVDVSSTSNDSPATISSTSSPEGTPTDTSKVSFVTYATEPSSVPVSSQEGSTEKGRTPTSTTSNDQTSHQVSTVENSGTTSSGPESPNIPVMSLLYHGLVSASNGGTTQSTHLPDQPRPLGQPAGTNPPEENLKPSAVQPNPTTASLGQNNAQLVSSAGLLPTPLEASQQFNSQHQKTPLGTAPGATVGAAPYTTVLGDSLLSVHTPSKPTVLKLQSPYATRFFPNQLPQHTISPTPPPTSITPEVAQLATSGQPQGSAFTNSQGSQPHTRIFFSPPSQNPKGQQQPLAAPPYFVSFRHDYVNPNKPTFPQGQVSYTTKQKVPAEVLLPHILSQEAAANENAPGGDKGLQNRVRPQQPSPPSNSGPQANQQVFAPPSYNPGFSPHFSLAPGYKGPVTTIILNPDLSSPYQFGSYVPRSESSDQKREGLYKVKSFVPSVSATVPGSPAYTATSFVPDRQTYSQGGKVFKVTSFVPRGSRPVQGGFRQTVQPIPNGQRSFPSAPGRTVYRVAPVGSRRSQPAQRLQDLHVTVIGPGGQLRAPQQRVFNIAPFAPQARAVSARQGLQPAGSAQSRFPPFRRRPQQAIVEVRAVPIQFHQRPAGHRVTPSFHEQPLTFYDVPQRQSAGGPALRPSVASANGPGFPNGRARFQPVQVVRKAVGPPSPPQPLIASAAYQAPVFHGVTRVVIRPGQSIVSR